MFFRSVPWGAVCLLLLLAGCAAPPPPPTTVDLAITGGREMNGGAPAKVKVYYLASPAAFRAGDFFALFDGAEAALGSDLVAVDEFQLAPGRTVTNKRGFDRDPVAIGVVAAFRNISGARFKAVRRLTPHRENPVRVTLSGNSVSIE